MNKTDVIYPLTPCLLISPAYYRELLAENVRLKKTLRLARRRTARRRARPQGMDKK